MTEQDDSDWEEPSAVTAGGTVPAENPSAAPGPFAVPGGEGGFAPPGGPSSAESPFAPPPGSPPPNPYGPPPGYGAPSGYGPPLGYAPLPGYGPPPGYGGPVYGQPGYGQPGYPGFNPYASRRKTNGLAVASLIVGLISVLLCQLGFIGIVAVVLGAIGLRRIKQGDEDGKGLAIAGIVTGGIGTLVGVVMIALLGAFANFGNVSSTTPSRSNTTYPYRTSTTHDRSTIRPGTTLAPATGPRVIALADCAPAVLSFRNLVSPEQSDQTELKSAAVVLHDVLPSTFGGDIDTILIDGLSRAAVNGDPGPSVPALPADVQAAVSRIGVVLDRDCPS